MHLFFVSYCSLSHCQHSSLQLVKALALRKCIFSLFHIAVFPIVNILPYNSLKHSARESASFLCFLLQSFPLSTFFLTTRLSTRPEKVHLFFVSSCSLSHCQHSFLQLVKALALRKCIFSLFQIAVFPIVNILPYNSFKHSARESASFLCFILQSFPLSTFFLTTR